MPRLEPSPGRSRSYRNHLREHVGPPFGVGEQRVRLIPGVAGEDRAYHAVDVVSLGLREHDVLEAAVVPGAHVGTERIDALAQRRLEIARPVDVLAAQLTVQHLRSRAG